MKRAGFTLIELLVVIAIIAILAAILFPVFVAVQDKGRQASCMSNVKQITGALMLYNQSSSDVFPPAVVCTDYRDYKTFVPQRKGGMPGSTYQTSDGTHFGYWVSWMDLIYPYMKTMKAFECPSIRKLTRYRTINASNYAYSPEISGINTIYWYGRGQRPYSLSEIKRPSKLFLAWDSGDPMGLALDGFYVAPACRDASLTYAHPHNDGLNFGFADGHVKWIHRMDAMIQDGTENTKKTNPHWWNL